MAPGDDENWLDATGTESWSYGAIDARIGQMGNGI